MRSVISLTFFFCAALSFAQRGDRGEAQPPPDARWVIPPAPVLSPAEAVTTFNLPAGFRAELVASEPLIHDPVTITVGPDGRLWVVEMTGYMRDVDGTGSRDPIGSVAVLRDTDGDGRMDQRTVFLDQLRLPRAIALVDDGVLLAEPPNLWFIRDTDGDGVGDIKTLVADDYGTDVENVEHLPNGLMWAIDNWIYSANHTVRFRYEGEGRFRREDTLMRGQWGITQDDVGRLFYNSNSDPLRCDVLPAEFLSRNPRFPARGTRVPVVPRTLRVWPGRITTGINRGYRTLDSDGRMYAVTAACGPVIYRGALFPSLNGDAFVAEPSGYLIKRITLTEDGRGIVGANAYEGTEFMTSTDERFRPVNLFNGPDGALWVVDMYRGFIQDRRFLTTYLRRQVLERGLDRPTGLGRIWRIVPDVAPAPTIRPDLDRRTPRELVDALSNPNGWIRDTAQRLLVEARHAQGNSAMLSALQELAIHGSDPLGRLHALWTLDGCGTLDPKTLLAALEDSDPRVVTAAVRLASVHLESASGGGIRDRLVSLAAKSRDPALRLQLALTLGPIATPATDEALIALLTAGPDQEFLADAAVSGLAGREAAIVAFLAADPRAPQCAGFLELAASSVLRGGEPADIDKVLTLAASENTAVAVRSAIFAGIKHFLPRNSNDDSAVGQLPARPTPLLDLAARQNSPLSAQAAMLLGRLDWPGKTAPRAPARPLTAAEQALFEKGKVQYTGLCAACHQPAGQGMPGLAPALVNSRWVNGDPEVLARIVLDGKASENLVMPPWKSLLDDESIAGVLTFVRRSWGHGADPVSVATVARMRGLGSARDEPWTDRELQQLTRGAKQGAKP